MRTLVDIPEKQLEALTRLAKVRKRSRAAIIRDAISAYLVQDSFGADDPAFGLWGDPTVGGLEYQRKLRSEW